MRNLIVRISTGLALFVNAVAAQSAVQETISVRLRDSYAICAGVCPNFTMTVSPSGQVISHSLWRGAGVYRYMVSAAQLDAFRRILDTVRPAGDRRLDVSCEQSRSRDGTPDPLDNPRPNDLEVRWTRPALHARLASCSYTHPLVRQTVESAVEALGVHLFDGRQEGSPP